MENKKYTPIKKKQESFVEFSNRISTSKKAIEVPSNTDIPSLVHQNPSMTGPDTFHSAMVEVTNSNSVVDFFP